MERFILIALVGLLSCSRANRPTEIATDVIDKSDSLDTIYTSINSIDNYSAAFIYMDTDSDSLLLDNEDFDNLIPLYKANGKLIEEKEYGSGDCAGKYRQFELNDGRLTIDKSSCGDYGFANGEFLMIGDSLLRVRKYEVQWNVLNKDYQLEISEQIFVFNNRWLTLKERYKTTNDWIGFDLTDIPFKSSSIDGQKEYDDLKKELAELLTYELIGE